MLARSRYPLPAGTVMEIRTGVPTTAAANAAVSPGTVSMSKTGTVTNDAGLPVSAATWTVMTPTWLATGHPRP